MHSESLPQVLVLQYLLYSWLASGCCGPAGASSGLQNRSRMSVSICEALPHTKSCIERCSFPLLSCPAAVSYYVASAAVTKWLLHSVKWPRRRLFFCSVLLLQRTSQFPLSHCTACKQSEVLMQKNWAELRAQTLKPFQEYGTALRIRNSTKNMELCAGLLKNASNIWKCTAINGRHEEFNALFVFACSDIREICHFLSLVASRLRCCRKKLAKSWAHGAKRFKEYGTYQEYETAPGIRNAGQITANA